MQKILLDFFSQVQKQGLAITLLVVASFFVIKQNGALQGKVDACMQMRIDEANKERVEFVQIMNEVREALEENTRAMRRRRDD